MTTRVMPPPGGQTRKIQDRTYIGVAGTPLDVPDGDAFILTSNGWTLSGSVGATAARPANPKKGDSFIDTTVGSQIVFDGSVWRHSTTHASV